VLGLHFLVFARIFREAVFVWLGAAVTVCGVAGVVMAVAGAAAAAISVAAGVVPGLILVLAVGQSAWAGRRCRLGPRGPGHGSALAADISGRELAGPPRRGMRDR